jgi:hypothetical protein
VSNRAPTVTERVDVAAWVTDPAAGEQLATQWVEQHRPERRVVTTSTHTGLYRGPGDVSARVSVVLDGETSSADALTLLVSARHEDVSIAAFPDDPALPTLSAVLSRAAVEPVLVDPLPGRVTTGPLDGFRAEVVHHPREGACVLRLDLAGESGPDTAHRQVYAKVYPQAHDASMAADALAAVGAATVGSSRTVEVRLPRLLALNRPLHTTFLESLTPATATRPPGQDAVPVGPAEAAQALRALHSHTPAGPLPSLTAPDLVSRVRVEQDLVATAWPDVSERLDSVLTNAAEVLDGGSGGPLVLSHGDFTPSQLIRLPDGLGLVDLDTLCLAEPAADLGRYLAYHDVAAARRASGAGDTDTGVTFLAAYGAHRAHRSDLDARVRAYRALNLALLVLRATRRFKTSRADLALTMLLTGTTTQGRNP